MNIATLKTTPMPTDPMSSFFVRLTLQMSRAPLAIQRRVGSICGLAGLRPSVWQCPRADVSLRRSARTPSHDRMP